MVVRLAGLSAEHDAEEVASAMPVGLGATE